MDDIHLKQVYKILNLELITFIEQAESIKQKELEKAEDGKEKNSGREPGK